MEAGGESLQLEVSIRGVVYGDDGEGRAVRTDDPDELIRFGDLALNRAKERPGGNFYLFDPAEEVQGAAQIRLEQALRVAVTGGQIVPYFQPVVRLEDGEPVGFEALARWRHPDRGLVPPNEFISLAEGVETEWQRRRLLELGCEYGQGFLFTEPLPPEQCGPRLAS